MIHGFHGLSMLFPEARDSSARVGEFVQRQKNEVDVLCGPLVGALWLIRCT